jgi:hypothetical protein
LRRVAEILREQRLEIFDRQTGATSVRKPATPPPRSANAPDGSVMPRAYIFGFPLAPTFALASATALARP